MIKNLMFRQGLGQLTIFRGGNNSTAKNVELGGSLSKEDLQEWGLSGPWRGKPEAQTEQLYLDKGIGICIILDENLTVLHLLTPAIIYF